jgi:hypothetical protein
MSVLLIEWDKQSSGLQLGDLPAEVSYLSDLNRELILWMSDAGEVMNIALLSMSLSVRAISGYSERHNSRKVVLIYLTVTLAEGGLSANREG